MSPRGPLRRRRIAPLRRGVYLLPSLLTTANIFSGFTSIVMTFQAQFHLAAILIIVAGILDGLDGRIARMTGATSEFGGEYDSLADVVSFGLAPAFLVAVWGLAPLRRYGWMLAFLFLVCGAIRLARFNIQHGASDRRWFIGLPIPMAAAALASCILRFENGIADRVTSILFGVLILAVSLLMVSRIRYRSFKDLDLRARRPFRIVLLIAAVMAGVALNPQLAIFVIAFVYLLSGPTAHLVALWNARRRFGRSEGAAGPVLLGEGFGGGSFGAPSQADWRDEAGHGPGDGDEASADGTGSGAASEVPYGAR